MTDYDNRGDIQLWKNDSDNPKAPNAKGNFIAHRNIAEGEAIEVALWKNDSDNPKAPLMKGKVSDKMQQQTGQQSQPDSGLDDMDDSSIPF